MRDREDEGNVWHLLTGEYPPQPGGVSDYARLVARGLADAGDAVTVWAPTSGGMDPDDAGVAVRRLPGRFGPRALAALDRELARRPGRVLLQYVPHAFGWKAMNVPLCAWLWARRPVLDVMFHEVAFPFERGQPWKHTLLAATHRAMAYLLLRAARRVFVSVPGWEAVLRPVAPRGFRPAWTPVPSNLPTACPAAAVAAARARLPGGSARRLVGHFGTYGPTIARHLEPAVARLLDEAADPSVLLLGKGGLEFADALTRRRPEFAGRILATGPLEAAEAAAHVGACDVMLQPYPDGVSARRGSVMAALALGRPIVATEGSATEPLWRASRAVEIAARDELAAAVLGLLNDASRRAELGRRAAELYRSRFAVEHTIRALRTIDPARPFDGFHPALALGSPAAGSRPVPPSADRVCRP